MIRHEETVETGAFKPLCEGLYMFEIEIRVGIRAGIPPPPAMDGGRAHKRTKAEFPVVAHGMGPSAHLICGHHSQKNTHCR
jgi:hypothetical protein